jgi:hypothetical protein
MILKTLKGRQLQVPKSLLQVRGGATDTDQVRDQKTPVAGRVDGADSTGERSTYIDARSIVQARSMENESIIEYTVCRRKTSQPQFRDLTRTEKRPLPPFLFVV